MPRIKIEDLEPLQELTDDMLDDVVGGFGTFASATYDAWMPGSTTMYDAWMPESTTMYDAWTPGSTTMYDAWTPG